jgi:UDP:flavonoid glycosyltransferase YjiC (YdhE family)
MGENAARVEWARVGLRMPWRLVTPSAVRFAVLRALGDSELRHRAQKLSVWAAEHDSVGHAAELVEELATQG